MLPSSAFCKMNAKSAPTGTATVFAATVKSPEQILRHRNNTTNVSSFDKLLAEAGSNHVVRNYGEKILEYSTSSFLQGNFFGGGYISNAASYYFQVNDEYVKNKVKIILFPFLHKGHWIREMEVGGGGGGREMSYKAPIYDINAPDLYIPVMAFTTYILLSGFFFGINGKFSPEALEVQFTTSILCWLLQTLLVGATLQILGGGGLGGDVPYLDLVAYGGYTFIPASVIIVTRILLHDHLFFAIALWGSLCMGIFMVKVIKRILVSELKLAIDHTQSNKRNYILLFVGISQIPLFYWLGLSCVRS